MSFDLGTVFVAQRVAQFEARSALPDAPVVAHRAPTRAAPRLRRTRSVTAAVLSRAAARVSPA